MNTIHQVVKQLHQGYQHHMQQHDRFLLTDFISEWQSPCYIGEPNEEGMIQWQAVPQHGELDFAGIERALELNLHPSVIEFFKVYWAGDLGVRFQEKEIKLIQTQGPEDFERLLENTVGHVLMKQKLKQPVTLFIGLTAEEDCNLTVDNATGAVGLEYVGKEQHHLYASSLLEFLQQCQPAKLSF